MLFEFNYKYHLWIFYEEDIDTYFKFKLANKLSKELKKLIIVWQENLYYTQKLQKQAYNKDVKPKSYIFKNKVWLNSKYIMTNQNWKLEAKFFGPL